MSCWLSSGPSFSPGGQYPKVSPVLLGVDKNEQTKRTIVRLFVRFVRFGPGMDRATLDISPRQ